MLTQTVEYALRAMVHLASLDGVAASSGSIAQKTMVPPGYLSKVLRDLVVGGLVKSYRGPHGGFTLSREPGAISILDVVNAVAPFQRIHRCPLGNPNHTVLCPLHQRLDNAMELIECTFKGTTLAQILGRHEAGDCEMMGRRVDWEEGGGAPPGLTGAGGGP